MKTTFLSMTHDTKAETKKETNRCGNKNKTLKLATTQ